MRRTVGQVIVASAIIEDTIGWVIVAVTFSLARTGRSIRSADEDRDRHRAVPGPQLHRRPPDRVQPDPLGQRQFRQRIPVITMILVIMGVMARHDLLGVQTVLGAFVAGILIGESPILTRHIEEQLRGLIIALFMPVFFGLAGLRRPDHP